jgi:hypothetical protein
MGRGAGITKEPPYIKAGGKLVDGGHTNPFIYLFNVADSPDDAALFKAEWENKYSTLLEYNT